MLSALVAVDVVSGCEQHWEAAKAVAGKSALENFQLAIGFRQSLMGPDGQHYIQDGDKM